MHDNLLAPPRHSKLIVIPLKGPKIVKLLIVELLHSWLAAIEKPNRLVWILFLDFWNSFNKVDHTILLTKLAVLEFLTFWFSGWQCAMIGFCKSEWTHVKAGVPQGTLVGPLCFACHIHAFKTGCDCIKYVAYSTMYEDCDREGHNS